MRQFAGFFFWTAWAAATERPGDTVTYTNNWPTSRWSATGPPAKRVVWTGVSIIMLLAGICGDGLVVRLAEGRGTRRARSPRPIRSAPGPPRRRSAPRSNTSGSSRR